MLLKADPGAVRMQSFTIAFLFYYCNVSLYSHSHAASACTCTWFFLVVSIYGKLISPLVVEILRQTEERLHVKISDPNNSDGKSLQRRITFLFTNDGHLKVQHSRDALNHVLPSGVIVTWNMISTHYLLVLLFANLSNVQCAFPILGKWICWSQNSSSWSKPPAH